MRRSAKRSNATLTATKRRQREKNAHRFTIFDEFLYKPSVLPDGDADARNEKGTVLYADERRLPKTRAQRIVPFVFTGDKGPVDRQREGPADPQRGVYGVLFFSVKSIH